MNLSKEKIRSIIANLPKQIIFLLSKDSRKLVRHKEQSFLSPYGLGDTFILCLFASAWENGNHKRIHFLIKRSHEFILKFFEIENYEIVSLEKIPLHLLGFKNSWSNIQEDKIFIAHMRMHFSFRAPYKSFMEGETNLITMYSTFLRLPKPSLDLLSIFRKSALRNLETFDHSNINLENTIFVSPSSRTLKFENDAFWNDLMNELTTLGYDIIKNDEQPIQITKTGRTNLSLDFSQIVSLGIACKQVITSRSGLSDLFSARLNGSIVLYPDAVSLQKYSIKKMYPGVSCEEDVYQLNRAEQIAQILASL
jgi:hypothetical protein